MARRPLFEFLPFKYQRARHLSFEHPTQICLNLTNLNVYPHARRLHTAKAVFEQQTNLHSLPKPIFLYCWHSASAHWSSSQQSSDGRFTVTVSLATKHIAHVLFYSLLSFLVGCSLFLCLVFTNIMRSLLYLPEIEHFSLFRQFCFRPYEIHVIMLSLSSRNLHNISPNIR